MKTENSHASALSNSCKEAIQMTTTLMSVPVFDEGLGMTEACIRRWILERRVASVKVGRLLKAPRVKRSE